MDFIIVQSGGGILQLLQTIPTVELIRFGYISHLTMHITQPLQPEFMTYQGLCLCFVETRKGEPFSLDALVMLLRQWVKTLTSLFQQIDDLLCWFTAPDFLPQT